MADACMHALILHGPARAMQSSRSHDAVGRADRHPVAGRQAGHWVLHRGHLGGVACSAGSSVTVELRGGRRHRVTPQPNAARCRAQNNQALKIMQIPAAHTTRNAGAVRGSASSTTGNMSPGDLAGVGPSHPTHPAAAPKTAHDGRCCCSAPPVDFGCLCRSGLGPQKIERATWARDPAPPS